MKNHIRCMEQLQRQYTPLGTDYRNVTLSQCNFNLVHEDVYYVIL